MMVALHSAAAAAAAAAANQPWVLRFLGG